MKESSRVQGKHSENPLNSQDQKFSPIELENSINEAAALTEMMAALLIGNCESKTGGYDALPLSSAASAGLSNMVRRANENLSSAFRALSVKGGVQ